MVFRAAALYWEDGELARAFVGYFILLWVLPVVLVVGGIAVFAASFGGHGRAGNEMLGLGLLFSCGVLVAALAMFIWLLVLLNRLRQLIPTSSSRRASAED
jgi:hypothetical protein